MKYVIPAVLVTFALVAVALEATKVEPVEKPEPLLCRWYTMMFVVTDYYDDKEKGLIIDAEYNRAFEYMQCSAYKGIDSDNIAIGRK